MLRRSRDPAGVLLYPKPAGVTSHDVVARVRRRIHERLEQSGGRRVKVGHAGTLDPFATGLLLVLVGRATRAQRFLTALPKTYRTVARLGWKSNTGDREGELVRTGRIPERLELPVGEIVQRPPAWSAVRVDGERLYDRARRGDPVEGEPRRVTIHRAEVLWREGDRAGIELECSAGTYVRQVVAGLEDAYCEQLVRVRVGPFGLENADEERLLPLDEVLGFLPEVELDADEAERVGHGVAVDPEGRWQVVYGRAGAPTGSPSADASADACPCGTVASDAGMALAPPASSNTAVRLTHEGRLVAVAEPRGERLQPTFVLAP